MFFEKDKIFDGAYGSQLINMGLISGGVRSERINITDPTAVESIHRAYIGAGADYICANTFGANPFYGDSFADEISAGIALAKKAAQNTSVKVGLDVGPTGISAKLLDFDRLYECFKAVVTLGERAGADFIILETFSNLTELRAALIAAKENTDLPVAALMSFEKNARSVYGVRPECFAAVCEALNADAVGANCSVGPADMAESAAALLRATSLPVILKPNAGVPIIKEGNAFYDLSADDFYKGAKKLKAMGADIIGGCCGTTEAYIEKLRGLKAGRRPSPISIGICSAQNYITEDFAAVGERINPTGKPKFRESLLKGELEIIDGLCSAQKNDGAKLLDVNVGIPVKEYGLMELVLDRVCAASDLPLVIDSSSEQVLYRALRLYSGKALVNSVSGKKESTDKILPAVKRYGAAVIGLCLDENGIPSDSEGRLRIAERIILEAEKCGIDRDNVYIDALTMSEASVIGGAKTALQTVEGIKKMGAKTVLGVSNISFGMPLREDINAAFLEKAVSAGLDLAIINPSYLGLSGSVKAHEFLDGKLSAEQFIEYASTAKKTVAPSRLLTLKEAIESGDALAAHSAAETMLEKTAPLVVAEKEIIPALHPFGDRYALGEMFLPELIASANAADAAFKLISKRLESGADKCGTLVIATVKGDIHDIGKNITAAVCRSYGIEVIDLGKDVSTEKVIEAAEKYYPCVVGLSALMTTTALNMEQTAVKVKERLDVPVLCGGAALNAEFCESFGGIYCATATDTAKFLNDYFKNKG